MACEKCGARTKGLCSLHNAAGLLLEAAKAVVDLHRRGIGTRPDAVTMCEDAIAKAENDYDARGHAEMYPGY